MNEQTVKVWDLAVRIFHWSLVTFFAIAWFTGDESEKLHSWAGYAVLGLVLFRIVWGFIGSPHARFKDFIYSPVRIVGYLKSLRSEHPEHYAGHNPAGGLMVILLLINLLVVCWTGLEAWGAEGHGPLAAANQIELIGSAVTSSMEKDAGHSKNKEAEKYWEEIHEIATDLMLILIVIHVGGVIVSSRLHRENLVRAMITGYKTRS